MHLCLSILDNSVFKNINATLIMNIDRTPTNTNTPLNMMFSLGQDSDYGKIDSLSQTFLWDNKTASLLQ